MQKYKSSLRFLSATTMIGAFLLCAPGLHAQTEQPASAVDAVGTEEVVNLTAKVVAIHAQSNTVTLKGPKGNTIVVDVDPATADIRKLKAGDEVDIAYRGALLVSADAVAHKGALSRETAEYVSPASNGTVMKARTVQVVATIRKLNVKTREVTLAGPKRTVSMTVSPDVDLGKFKVGDNIAAKYIGAMAVTVKRNGEVLK
jgi:Cu/Ag efflux protein CusF